MSRPRGKRATSGAHVMRVIMAGPTMDRMDGESGGAEPVSASTLPLAHWRPQPALVMPETVVERPRFPVVDIHNHIGRWLSPTSQWLGGAGAQLVGGRGRGGGGGGGH